MQKPCSVVAFYARAPQLPGHLPERVLPGQAEDCPRREERKKDERYSFSHPPWPSSTRQGRDSDLSRVKSTAVSQGSSFIKPAQISAFALVTFHILSHLSTFDQKALEVLNKKQFLKPGMEQAPQKPLSPQTALILEFILPQNYSSGYLKPTSPSEFRCKRAQGRDLAIF